MQDIINGLIEQQNNLKRKKETILAMKTTDFDARIATYQKAIDALKKVV